MDVSVIIVNYNTLQMTKDCIDSIFEKTEGLSFEIILVDNASTDGSKEFFEKETNMTYLYSSENLGFGKGNNLGLSVATGKYVLFLNSDTLLLNNALFDFFRWMENQPESIGCCGCVLTDANDNFVNSFQDIQGIWYFTRDVLAWNHIYIKPRYNSKVLPFLKYPRKVGFIVGADLFVRRSCIERCGSFDPDFFMYYEETEMQYRFHEKGYDSWCIDTAKIKHLVGQSNKKLAKKNLHRFIGQLESRYLYIIKTKSVVERYMIYFIHLFYLPLLPFKMALPGERKRITQLILKPFLPFL